MRFPFGKKTFLSEHDARKTEVTPPELPSLCLAAGALAQIIVQGRHGQRRVGMGENFWQFRPHQPHEPAALIDWRQSARSADPTLRWVRERERDVPQALILWVDPSSSMRWASQKSLPEKYHIALTAALALGASAMKAGERVNVLGQRQWYQNIQKLPLLARDLTSSSSASSGATPHGAERFPSISLAPPHASLLLVSDFLWEEEQLAAIFRLCHQRPGRCTLLSVQDPAEETLPYKGHIRFHDPEDTINGENDIILSAVEDLTSAYQAHKQAHDNIIRAIAGPQISLFTCSTDKPLIEPLMALYRHLGA